MKKILIALVLGIGIIGCSKQQKIQQGNSALLKEITINHSKEDSVYTHYGYYKEVFRVYNYHYKDSSMYAYVLDSTHHVDAFINEYGDTVYKVYIDVSNYPRREE